jgi:hypothetical protein
MSNLNLNDVLVIEGEQESTEEGYYASLQRAINSLDAWKLQGSYGRTMMAAIEEGRCMLGRKPTADYYRNRIPSRDEVQAGTKGSRQFVVQMYGEAWAADMEAVQ